MTTLDDEKVGYGRPPTHSRFKPGQSGNPRGRKRGAKGAASVLAGILAQKVTVTENGKRRRITMLEVATKQLVNKAAAGDNQASKLLFGIIASAGERLFDTGTIVTQSDEEGIALVMARFAGLSGDAR